jgi:hypothetical protein
MGGASPPHPHLVQQDAEVWIECLQEPTCTNLTACLPLASGRRWPAAAAAGGGTTNPGRPAAGGLARHARTTALPSLLGCCQCQCCLPTPHSPCWPTSWAASGGGGGTAPRRGAWHLAARAAGARWAPRPPCWLPLPSLLVPPHACLHGCAPCPGPPSLAPPAPLAAPCPPTAPPGWPGSRPGSGQVLRLRPSVCLQTGCCRLCWWEFRKYRFVGVKVGSGAAAPRSSKGRKQQASNSKRLPV